MPVKHCHPAASLGSGATRLGVDQGRLAEDLARCTGLGPAHAERDFAVDHDSHVVAGRALFEDDVARGSCVSSLS